MCLSALYTNKKRRRIFPYGCCPPGVCVFVLFVVRLVRLVRLVRVVRVVRLVSYMVWRTTGGQQTGGFANLLSALKSPTYQGFSGLADKADNTDNRVVKIAFLSARCPPEKGLGGQQPIWRTTIFRENLLSACCPPEAFVVRLKESPSGWTCSFAEKLV